ADEIQTGFGRTGKMLAIEEFGIKPDIITMAKGLGAGMPIGGYITTDEIANCLESGDHFSTFGGNPVSCAVALENLNYLEDAGLVKNSEKIGGSLMKQLKEIQESNNHLGEVRGRGLMIGIELVKDKGTKEPAVEETESVAKNLMKNGVLVGTGGVKKNVIRLQPPLCMTEEEAQKVLSLLETEFKQL
ncbi:MAG: aminotransferase class III-fold pyridoxal phosphate-dependent enzyme, partial [Candidatus Thorarchaeota archaeon]